MAPSFERRSNSVHPTPQGFVDVEFVVERNYCGWRLDRYICQKLPRLSRTKVQRIIAQGLISDRALKSSTPVSAGLSFRIRRRIFEEPETPTFVPELYRDQAILVLDKPAGLPIHPTARYRSGTLVTLLLRHYGSQLAAPLHRLDRETSGVLVCGCDPEATRSLMRAFAQGEVHKEYLAICEGAPSFDEFEVDAPIAQGGRLVRIAVRVDRAKGKPAQTQFRVLKRFERHGETFALVRARPRTGRQHQIRVHLREAGLPVVGDKIYGPDEGYFDRFSKHCLEPEAVRRLRLPRHALHAGLIQFEHPSSKSQVSFQSPLPADLEAFLRS
jgi:23S rRNA pseudouridine1911/1915/1917 synthase